MLNIFISYAREDIHEATELFSYLRSNGFQPWMDKKNLIGGLPWEKAIEKALLQSDICIFLLSSTSCGKRGVFQREMKLALRKAQDMLEDDIHIIPIKLEECEIPDSLRHLQWIEGNTVDRKHQIIDSLREAAKQRGLVMEKMAKSPFVSGYKESEERSQDGSYVYGYSIPIVEFPNDSELEEVINSTISGQVFSSVMRFKTESGANYAREFSEQPNRLYHDVEMTLLNEDFMSAVFKDYHMFSGAAHGVPTRNSLNVYLPTQNSFSIYSIFSNRDLVYDKINPEIESQEIESLIDNQRYKDVSDNSLQNKSYICDDGVVIAFDPYDIFCFAFGDFDVKISWDLLRQHENSLSDIGRSILDSIHR